MTGVFTEVNAFRDALPETLRGQLRVTDRVVSLIRRAVQEQGWTIPQLAAECSRDLGGIYKPGGLITHRLEHCAEGPPAVRSGRPRVHHGCCEGGFLYDESGDEVVVTKCPGNAP